MNFEEEYLCDWITKSYKMQNIGLLNGKMGVCLFYFKAGKTLKNKKYTQYAETLLDEIYESLSIDSPTNFSQGLSGIGWAIEYLVQEEYVEGNADEILYEIDNAVLKEITKPEALELGLDFGLVGYLLYLIQRLKNEKKTKDTLISCLKEELFIWVINKISECYQKHLQFIANDFRADLFRDFPVLIYALMKAHELNIYNSKIERIIIEFVPYLERNWPSLNINKLYLVCILKYMSTRFSVPRLDKLTNVLLYSIDFDHIFEEIEEKAYGIRNGLSGLKYVLFCFLKLLSHEDIYRDIIFNLYLNIPEIQTSCIDNIELNLSYCDKIGLSEGFFGMKLIELLLFR